MCLNNFRIILLLFIGVLSINAQVLEADTVYFDRKGKMSYQFTQEGKLQGSFVFESILLLDQWKKDGFYIQGFFSNGKRDRLWTWTKQDFEVTPEKFTIEKVVKSNQLINGKEVMLTGNYREGIPNGKWTLEKTSVENNIILKESLAVMKITNGILVDQFSFKNSNADGNIEIKGQLNKDGFLDGRILLSYIRSSLRYNETRTYENGFLRKVEIRDVESNSVVNSVSYKDVDTILSELKNLKDTSFKISENGFGIDFNVGYDPANPKLSIQRYGNQLFNDFVQLIQSFEIENEESESIQFNLTRRFKLVYPEKDVQLLDTLSAKNSELIELTSDFLNNPRLILNKSKSRKLTESFHLLEMAHQKLQIIDSVVQKSNEGYFDFISRDLFYREGLPGLTVVDTLRYSYDKKDYKIIFPFDKVISNNQNFLLNLLDYSQGLQKLIETNIEFSRKELLVFEQESQIEALDERIVNKLKIIDTIYLPLNETWKSKDFKERPIHYNVLDVHLNGLINETNKKYLNEKTFQKKIELGEELNCLLDFFIDSENEMKELDQFSNRIDRMFTIFRDNPFLDRKMETKIYGNINRKSREILVPEYINGMLRSKNCQDLILNFRKLMLLEDRLAELVEKNDASVQEIDRYVRRENMPQRIERILGIQELN
jgi:hypothetical protein